MESFFLDKLANSSKELFEISLRLLDVLPELLAFVIFSILLHVSVELQSELLEECVDILLNVEARIEVAVVKIVFQLGEGPGDLFEFLRSVIIISKRQQAFVDVPDDLKVSVPCYFGTEGTNLMFEFDLLIEIDSAMVSNQFLKNSSPTNLKLSIPACIKPGLNTGIQVLPCHVDQVEELSGCVESCLADKLEDITANFRLDFFIVGISHFHC